MNQNVLLVLTVTLSLLGLADAWYLTQSAIQGSALVCDIQGLTGCNTVAQSSYSRLFGVPLALYGTVFYTGLFVLSSLFFMFNTRILYRLLLLGGVLGFLASLYFLFLQVFLIKAFCIYCIASFFIATGICVTVSLLYRQFLPQRLIVVP